MTQGLFLSQADSRPMYSQIVEQIKLKIMAGDWPSEHPLPSIRELAASTQVSVITVKRAYLELEQEGLIVTRQGRGSFVSGNMQQEALRETELSRHMDSLLDTAIRLGFSPQDALRGLELAIEKRKRQ